MNKNITILIVEDEKIPAEFLKEFLEHQGYTIIDICTTGDDAIQVAQHKKPDIILMDIILKGQMSGAEAAVKISTLIETKIIFLTAYLDDEMMEYALTSGAVNYLLKPYREKQILVALEIANKASIIHKEVSKKVISLSCGYQYNIEKQRLIYKEKEININHKSLQLIHYLVLHVNTAVSKEELSNYIYGEVKESSTIRTLVFRLRKQLDCNLIQNISGLGYKILSN
jgi:DNA-binding response OmpR family regulator